MIRNAIKISGLLALMALALGVGAASPAGAEVTLTAGTTFENVIEQEETSLMGVQYGGTTDPEGKETTNYFEAGAEGKEQKLHCDNEGVSYTGTAHGSDANVTITPEYNNCRTLNANHEKGLFVTVTENGCDYTFNQPEAIEVNHHYKGTASLTCPVGKTLEVHLFLDKNHTIPVCTLTVEPFPNKGHVTYTNQKNGDGGFDDVTVKATVTGIPYIEHGSCDPEGKTPTREDGEFFSDVTLTSPNHDITLSGE